MEKSENSRRYPPMYEKIIPFAIWGIAIIVLILLVITIAVALQV